MKGTERSPDPDDYSGWTIVQPTIAPSADRTANVKSHPANREDGSHDPRITLAPMPRKTSSKIPAPIEYTEVRLVPQSTAQAPPPPTEFGCSTPRTERSD